MMKKIAILLVLLLFSILAYCQKNDKFNLDFETQVKGIPIYWNNFGGSNYQLGLDSSVVQNGKYAASIEYKNGDVDYKALSFNLPDNYVGKKITLSGYIKTENVTEGYAGLWMRIDPSLGFDNMEKNGIKGSTDWTKYEITLDLMPEKTKKIVLGGLLVGKGKMWIDHLAVSIDGKDISEAKVVERQIFLAEKDHEFDKNSRINSIDLDKKMLENTRILGLVWGFLKYYHPAIANGNYNWDYELFRVFPKLQTTQTKKERDELLVDWISKLGTIDATNAREATTDIKFEPDLDWIKKEGFSKELTTLLLNIQASKRPKTHFYVGLTEEVGNPEFKNENPYTSMKYPDAGFRLLALYRYWNIIQYYFPYKNLIKEDWKGVLAEFIPKIIEAKDETAYTLAILELIGRVQDTHANIWGRNEVLNKYWGLNFAPIELTFIENKAVVTSYYDAVLGKETGLNIGDIVTSVNHVPIETIIKERLKYTPASNYTTQLRNIASNLLRSNDTLMTLEYLRGTIKQTQSIKVFSTKKINIFQKNELKDTCFKYLSKDIAYLNNGSLKRAYLPTLWKAIQSTKGLVIDIRNYPSDFPIYELSNYLMPDSLPFVQFTEGSLSQPGRFAFLSTLSVGKKNPNAYQGKIVLLLNEKSQSSAEFHAMAYKVHPNATIIGSTTAGADGNVSPFYLPSGISTMISGIGVYYPNRAETQGVGIAPNILLRPTIQGIKEGRDELLEKAIEVIKKTF
jgi:C-terminal processing protease CtpA/Prc